MLIYDHNRQFLGLDNEDLQQLGFASATVLFEQCSDFADLFVKRPGYIHNFKNFEWIDFVLHAKSDDSKAIIHTSKNNFTCKLAVKPFYLNSSPNEHGYMVLLKDLKPLSAEEDAKVAHDIEMHPTPDISAPIAPSPKIPLPDVSLPNFDNLPATELSEPDIFDVPMQENSFELPALEEDVKTAPFKLDIEDIYTQEAPSVEEKFEPQEETALDSFTLPEEETLQENAFVPTASRSNLPDIPMLGDHLSQEDHDYIDNLHTDKDYIYDPHIAADELGLPVDLIEEFIGDFIQQSHDFHDELFEKADAQDRDSIQTLSHKLKGVAANLRIEDAFEALSIINTSHDFNEITANLKYFYHLVAKLKGDESATLELSTNNQEDTENEEMPLKMPEQDFEKPEKKEEELINPIEDILKDSEDPLKALEEEPLDEEIYSFEMLRDDTEVFDIPQKPPVFETTDDEVYDFKTLEESIKEDAPIKEIQEEELFEIKQADDEPLLVIEPEIKVEETLSEKQDFIELDETIDNLDKSDKTSKEDILTVEDKLDILIDESDKTSKEDVVTVEDKTDILMDQKKQQNEIKSNSALKHPHSANKAHNKRRKQKSKKGEASFIQVPKPELKIQPKPAIEVQEEALAQTTATVKPSKPSTPEIVLHFNSQEVSHELGLPCDFIKELARDFKTDSLVLVDEISNAISSFDAATWQQLAKEYKGISDNLRLNEISTELQMLIQTNDAQKAKTALSRYRNYLNQL